MSFDETGLLLMSDIIIKNNSGPRSRTVAVPCGIPLKTGLEFAYTTWYSNIVGSVS